MLLSSAHVAQRAAWAHARLEDLLEPGQQPLKQAASLAIFPQIEVTQHLLYAELLAAVQRQKLEQAHHGWASPFLLRNALLAAPHGEGAHQLHP